MKGKVLGHIRQRQYEFISVELEFSNKEEYKKAMDFILETCREYDSILCGERWTPEKIVKHYGLPEGTILKKIFNKDIGENMYFDIKTGVNHIEPT